MRANRSILASLLAVVAAVGLNACGKSGNKSLEGKRAVTKPAISEECARKLGGKSQKLTLEEGIEICAFKPEGALSEDEKKREMESEFAIGSSYKPKKIVVTSSLGITVDTSVPETAKKVDEKAKTKTVTQNRSSRRVTAKLIVLVSVPKDSLSEDQAKAVRNFAESCYKNKIEPMWQRSWSRSGKVDPDIKFVLDGDEEAGEADQDLVLEVDPTVSAEDLKSEKKYPRLSMQLWPYHSSLAPAGHPACDAKCADKSEGAARKGCQKDCLTAQSEPFCRSLARLSAHWLGVKDPMAAKGCQLKEGEAHPLAKTSSILMGYRRGSDTTTETAGTEKVEKKEEKKDAKDAKAEKTAAKGDFWSKASVDGMNDIKKLVQPLCKDVEKPQGNSKTR